MRMGPNFHLLWPTPMGMYPYPEAAGLNPALVNAIGEERAASQQRRGEAPGPFFASDDDLLARMKLPEWQDFVSFAVSSLIDTVRQANREAWAGQSFDLTVGIEGMWFQTSRDGAFHDIHSHGNCSWGGLYIVQIDEPERRRSHPVYGQANGITRFYGPPFATLGGAFVDVGNAYLQPPHLDVEPVPGQLVLFPSWLAHKAMPYGGEKERVIVSFNASIHASKGDQIHGYSPH